MRHIPRRVFLLTALAAAPLASCASPPRSSLAQRRRTGAFVRAGQDRTGHPRRVFGGLHIDAKVTPTDTAGDLYVIEHTDEAKGGPPRHIHHAQDEWFYVLEGAYRFDVGEERFDLGPGDSVLAPRGVPHVWAHVSEGAGRLIIAFQPAGQMESFLGALAEMGSTPPPEQTPERTDGLVTPLMVVKTAERASEDSHGIIRPR
jgi:mannose-6-phosphate isomerase-like protein (cupin superfamily)